MALLDPNRPADAARDGPHPALSLLAGFGVIVGAAVLVHLVFNVLI